MTSGSQSYDFPEAKEIALAHFRIRGYQVRSNAKIHPTIARRFSVVARDRDSTIGIELLTREKFKSSKSEMMNLLTIQRSATAVCSTSGNRLEVAVVLANSDHAIHLRTICEENGTGLYIIENHKLAEMLKPSQRVTTAKLEAREIQDLIGSINARSQARFSMRMFTIGSKQIEKLDLHCKTDNDITAMGASFNTIIDSINKDEMEKMGTKVPGHATTIDCLQQFLADNKIACPSSAFKNLKYIKRFRNKRYPLHDLPGYSEICRNLTGSANPDNSTLATSLISRFLNALGFLRNAL